MKKSEKLNEPVKLTINGKSIIVDRETTIFEAAAGAGIEIPTLCRHPRLEPPGHCRLCLVEVEGLNAPVTSCDNPVAPGMVVETESDKLASMRKAVIELYLATHPYEDCLTCLRTGSCELQEQAYRFGVELPPGLKKYPRFRPDHSSDLITRDEDKCIICGRCIAVCRSGPGCDVFEIIGSGVDARVVPTAEGREATLEEAGCVFCGQCLDVCPVDALRDNRREGAGREWDLEEADGICGECSLGCKLTRRHRGGKTVSVTVQRHGEKSAWLCRRGKFGSEEAAALKLPGEIFARHDSGSYSGIGYSEALKRAADEIAAIRAEFGPAALALRADGTLSNEEAYLVGKLGREVIGTGNIDLGVEPGWVRASQALDKSCGSSTPGPAVAEIRDAERIVLIGTGLEDSHPVDDMAVSQAIRFSGATLINIGSAGKGNGGYVYPSWRSIELDPGPGDYGLLLQKIAAAGAALTASGGNLEADGTGEKSDYDYRVEEAARALGRGEGIMIIVTPAFFASAQAEDVDSMVALLKSFSLIRKGVKPVLFLSRFSNASGIASAQSSAQGEPVPYSAAAANGDPRGGAGEPVGEQVRGIIYFGQTTISVPGGTADPQASQARLLLAHLARVSAKELTGECGAEMIIPATLFENREGHFTNASGQTRFNKAIAPLAEQDGADLFSFTCDLARALGTRWSYNNLDDLREEMSGLALR